ncbi:MAG: alaS, partial [Francisellaceae bacterium]|nr:alaS [Francisellaceae bacterium]
RRAIRHGYRLKMTEPFFYKLVKPLIEVMGEAYPTLINQQTEIEKIIKAEELQFSKTLSDGLKLLESDLKKMDTGIISGETVFRLYDTYGFPVDLTQDIARERNLTVDILSFEKYMQEQKKRSKEAGQFSIDYNERINIEHISQFHGYQALELETHIVAILKEDKQQPYLSENEEGMIILSNTPFYSESGGQVGDQGILRDGNNEFKVEDTQKINNAIVHKGKVVKGRLVLNALVTASVDKEKRAQTALNHTATHLLHAALRELLGKTVQQKGSLVDSKHLRFDFSYSQGLTLSQLQMIEDKVNEEIRLNSPVDTEELSLDKALEKGAMALFGEKYTDKVRLLSMGGDFSKELCGGTHANFTGEIGLFKIISETGVSAGIRRIEALTGQAALQMAQENELKLSQISDYLKTNKDSVIEKLELIMNKNKILEKENQKLIMENLSKQDFQADIKIINGVKVLIKVFNDIEIIYLREMVDRFKNQFKTGVIIFASIQDKKISLIAGVTEDCVNKVTANEIIKQISSQIGGQGGGKASLAQGGGVELHNLDAALASVLTFLVNHL